MKFACYELENIHIYICYLDKEFSHHCFSTCLSTWMENIEWNEKIKAGLISFKIIVRKENGI